LVVEETLKTAVLPQLAAKGPVDILWVLQADQVADSQKNFLLVLQALQHVLF
jgi:hypothetical protein